MLMLASDFHTPSCLHAERRLRSLLSGGRFYAPMFQARATWDVTEDKHLMIDWAKFGKYDLELKSTSPPAFEVCVRWYACGGV